MWRFFPALLIFLGCSSVGPANFESKSANDLEGRKVKRIAIYPLEALSGESKSKVPFIGEPRTANSPAALLSRQIYSAMSQMPDWQVVSDREVKEMEPLVPPGSPEARARRLGQLVYADAVLSGRLLRFREREGEALGVKNPASVAFVLELWDVKTGDVLWSGRFDETQQALSENLLGLGQVASRGVKWLTAEELAREGVKKAVDQLHKALYGKKG
jgi:TolB-like protein